MPICRLHWKPSLMTPWFWSFKPWTLISYVLSKPQSRGSCFGGTASPLNYLVPQSVFLTIACFSPLFNIFSNCLVLAMTLVMLSQKITFVIPIIVILWGESLERSYSLSLYSVSFGKQVLNHGFGGCSCLRIFKSRGSHSILGPRQVHRLWHWVGSSVSSKLYCCFSPNSLLSLYSTNTTITTTNTNSNTKHIHMKIHL